MPHGSDDETTRLALAAKAGDQSAAADFVRLTQRDLLRFLSLLADARELEDLAQETYLRCMRALPQFDARSTARTWLFAIARRVAADHVRRSRRRPRTSPLDALDEAARPPAGPRVDEAVALRALVDALEPARREAFALTQILGLSYEEAADVCGCPVGTIRSRVARAREELISAMRSTQSTVDGAGGRPTRRRNRAG